VVKTQIVTIGRYSLNASSHNEHVIRLERIVREPEKPASSVAGL